MGVSGGAPYALAAAYRIPERLISCGIISGIGPLKLGTTGMSRENRLVLFLAPRSPWLLTPLMSATARSFRDEEHARTAVTKAMKRMLNSDRQALLAHGAGEQLAISTRETYRQGARGAVYEGRLYGRDWGFRLEDIAFQPLYLWHGTADTNVPIGMARGVAGRLSRCQATYYPDEGHFAALLNHQLEFFVSRMSAICCPFLITFPSDGSKAHPFTGCPGYFADVVTKVRMCEDMYRGWLPAGRVASA
jgi:pimeloyl-ACP methyl ester carboxylesterase